MLVASKVTELGGQMLSFGGGVRYRTDTPDNGSEDWGVRMVSFLLFPK